MEFILPSRFARLAFIAASSRTSQLIQPVAHCCQLSIVHKDHPAFCASERLNHSTKNAAATDTSNLIANSITLVITVLTMLAQSNDWLFGSGSSSIWCQPFIVIVPQAVGVDGVGVVVGTGFGSIASNTDTSAGIAELAGSKVSTA